jgi:hypothetical protein
LYINFNQDGVLLDVEETLSSSSSSAAAAAAAVVLPSGEIK